ncbi:hypothetical protein ACFQT0_30430 [Hymenobacter humi]|uniref:Uncharacterized protein n=1 Tax=Hymenobacter humi TaxID=1411620 RepID=A0ABW2UEH3_9BACT
MARSYPFYSRNRNAGVVYHSHAQCPVAHAIPEPQRIAGIPWGWLECAHCARLGLPLPGPAAHSRASFSQRGQ